jgi:guanylate kinase
MSANASQGSLFIISGPSGSGKGTVVKTLAASDPCFALSVSVTTRIKRDCEEDGVHYFFKSVSEFEELRDNDQLLEHAHFVGSLYGTPRSYVEDQIEKGKVVLVNGALQVKDKFPEAVLIFLMPPTMRILEQRLIVRNTEDKETIEDRLRRAREEVRLIDKYDYLVINDKVEDAENDINTIVNAEYLKPFRHKEQF